MACKGARVFGRANPIKARKSKAAVGDNQLDVIFFVRTSLTLRVGVRTPARSVSDRATGIMTKRSARVMGGPTKGVFDFIGGPDVLGEP